jgi:D-aspartate ligase
LAELTRTHDLLPDSCQEEAGLDWPPAVIAGAYQTGVLGVRSLVRRNVRSCLFDCDSQMPGFKSTYGPALLCPDPDVDPEAWLRFMLRLAAEHGQRAVLIASADKFVTAIARHSDTLQRDYIISPGVALHAALAEKQTQYQLAMQHGMPMPRTSIVSSLAEVETFGREASFPCLIKPTHFREWQKFESGHPLLNTKVRVVESASALCASYQLAANVTPQLVLQEVIQGDDSCKLVYLSCYDSRGRRIANAMFRPLRCEPMGFGPATVMEPASDPEVDAICDSFLKRIGYTGICEIEMKRDTRDGRVKLIEANPRLSGSGDAAPYSGVDICWLHYLDLIGRPVRPVSPRDNYFKHVVLRSDACAIPQYLRARAITWRDVWNSYRGPLAFYDIDWRDWRYSVETIYLSARSFLWRMLRSLFGHRN